MRIAVAARMAMRRAPAEREANASTAAPATAAAPITPKYCQWSATNEYRVIYVTTMKIRADVPI